MMAGRLRRYTGQHGGALLLGAAGALALLAALFGGEAAVSTTEFCVSCHSMSYPAKELKKSSHYGALGVNPGCKDCHIPQGLANFHLAIATHVVDGARELILEFKNDYSDIKKFDARRPEMAHDARMNLKRWDSVTCRACHKDPQPPGADARAAHDKMRTQKATCIDCHQNLVHKEVPETDLDASLAQGRRIEKKD
ncbi:MAG: cytochrome C [Rhodocyclaceae bacterium UTPRO2]|jgi:nitrate/TMAO reductase-like tetraheme cytochrome c subunit|nr:MAG: cytochrome C [Rhodocyclaceae bacterium UTPRO2]